MTCCEIYRTCCPISAKIIYCIVAVTCIDCSCTIDEMSSAVSGRKVGKEYQFYLNKYNPIGYTFSKELFLVLDEETLYYDYAN